MIFGLVAGLTNWRLGFDPRSVHARFLVNEFILEKVPSGTLILPSQYHSANAPYSSLSLKVIHPVVFAMSVTLTSSHISN